MQQIISLCTFQQFKANLENTLRCCANSLSAAVIKMMIQVSNASENRTGSWGPTVNIWVYDRNVIF